MSNQKKLKIKIFDKEYSLLVENEERAKDLGDYVNTLMNDLREDMSDQPSQTVAVLASLNIANDLFAEKESFNKSIDKATERINKLNLLLEDIS
ncbi:MAG: cell division protein ZapA [Bacteroidetes bacterium]|nr:cell division protein ZapA [Bacteroidota bacterium]MBU2584868.1 cell division protein ZapA [Bacteroidota bacterium]